MEQELFKIFGGYRQYMDAPFDVVQKHRLILLARWKVEQEKQAEIDKQLEETKRRLT